MTLFSRLIIFLSQQRLLQGTLRSQTAPFAFSNDLLVTSSNRYGIVLCNQLQYNDPLSQQRLLQGTLRSQTTYSSLRQIDME
jgi:hypothetical protein